MRKAEAVARTIERARTHVFSRADAPPGSIAALTDHVLIAAAALRNPTPGTTAWLASALARSQRGAHELEQIWVLLDTITLALDGNHPEAWNEIDAAANAVAHRPIANTRADVLERVEEAIVAVRLSKRRADLRREARDLQMDLADFFDRAFGALAPSFVERQLEEARVLDRDAYRRGAANVAAALSVEAGALGDIRKSSDRTTSRAVLRVAKSFLAAKRRAKREV